jgi:hypothetical protein
MPSQVNIFEMFVVYSSVFYTLYYSCCRSQICYIIVCTVYALYDFKQHYPSVVICYDSFKHSSLWFTPASNVKSIIHNKTLSYILFIINTFFVATKTKNLIPQMSQIFHTMNSIFEACFLIILSTAMNITVSFIDE